mmetsp:Transcript_21535/g.51386  ORF Transcript_21535/g.51386 Transcript_21535/m.51386 type:complete len:212 (+) Transcript_21535:1249-1884(+)
MGPPDQRTASPTPVRTRWRSSSEGTRPSPSRGVSPWGRLTARARGPLPCSRSLARAPTARSKSKPARIPRRSPLPAPRRDRTGRAAGDWRAAAGRVSAAPDLACARVLAAVEPAPPVGDGVAVERGAADALVDRVVEAAHPVLELGPAPGNWRVVFDYFSKVLRTFSARICPTQHIYQFPCVSLLLSRWSLRELCSCSVKQGPGGTAKLCL